ncbi:MAG: 50S ribosomal protein L17 [Candidatus Moranbacteria bacterium CG_4_9_14_3_um_filter_40_7]|nr:50S ribosomal protein L17 [bacterium]PIP26542.1 MAG: 50S ribosomal protein L17 [Candidatus Moranbacteria bacterium CG23_combo_of_CG06-09_8_20_14_all_40_16]PIU80844.1 MAG: 50S ribosomal protein L17 [Candidatus Moranbacteria bacterium CG06_land_8_20_14_3_00_40_12]PJA88136.1 MAG: 50S ribosomal protein L17 [Candidatus Moranbacteria bacterium CG_4_9_14_3_um_filter_40_7]
MKHQKKARELGRPASQRKALLRSLLSSLIIKGKITTTEAKAKEIKKKIDPLINKAKKLEDKALEVVVLRNLNNDLSQTAVKKLTGEFIKRFIKRNSGYTRIAKLNSLRNDNAEMAVIEFVD